MPSIDNFETEIMAIGVQTGAELQIQTSSRVGGADGIDRIGVQFDHVPTIAGSYVWSIPFRWGVADDSCTNLITVLTQTFSTDGNGNTTVRKNNMYYQRNAFDDD